jgi:dTDP-4-dehydrorhamnose reductase
MGIKGQVGRALESACGQQGVPLLGLDLPEFDITDPKAVSRIIRKTDASLVINAAAYTAVDGAESDPATAFAVNRDGPAYMAASCAERRIPLIHMSTDYVFDGEKKGPYVEDDPVSPLGIYGKSKAEGDAAVRSLLNTHVIVRTSWVCGVNGSNFVKTMLRLGQEQTALRVVSDQFGCPTFAEDIAETLLRVASQVVHENKKHWGTFHYTGKGRISWFELAREIFRIAGTRVRLKVKTLEPISTAQYPTPAKRPANSSLDCTRIGASYGIQQKPWKEGLRKLIEQLIAKEAV